MAVITSHRETVYGPRKANGTIYVKDGRRRYRVKWDLKGDHAEQWGANTEILCVTYPLFESLVASIQAGDTSNT